VAIGIGDAVLNITGDNTGLNNALKSSQSSMQKFAADLGRQSRQIGIAFTAMGATITGALGFCVKAFADSEKASAQLEAVLKSTGGAAGMTADELKKLASGFQQTTAYEDDAVVAAEALMLTFVNVSKDIFPQAMEAVLDVSTALGTDLQSSVLMVGKALNDPIVGMTALTRSGIQFSEQQKDVIKYLMETGQGMEAQKIVLAELAKQMGGSARAELQTFSGQLAQMKNQLGDMAENIGASLMPVLRSMMETVKPIIGSIGEWITQNPELVATIATFGGALGVLMVGLGPLLIALPVIVGGFAALLSPVGAVAALIGGALAIGLFALGDWIKNNWDTISSAFKQGFEVIKSVVLTLVGIVQDAAASIASHWDMVSSSFQAVGSVIWDVASGIGSAIGEMAGWISQHWEQISENFWAGARMIGDVMKIIGNVIGSAWEIISAVVAGFLRGIGVGFDDLSTVLVDGANSVSGTLETVNAYIAQFRAWLDEHWDSIASGAEWVSSHIVGLFTTIIDWGGKAIDVLRAIFWWVDDLARVGINAAEWAFGNGGGMSHGGPALKGMKYTVGERGGEVFFPSNKDHNPNAIGLGGTQKWKAQESGWILNHEGVHDLLGALPVRVPGLPMTYKESLWKTGILNALISNRVPATFYDTVWSKQTYMKGLLETASARATGGSVSAFQPYVIGERGREIMVPSQSGAVLNIQQAQDALVGALVGARVSGPGSSTSSGTKPKVNVNMGGVNVTVSGFLGNARQFAKEVGPAISEWIGENLLHSNALVGALS
jgi:phage-related protein